MSLRANSNETRQELWRLHSLKLCCILCCIVAARTCPNKPDCAKRASRSRLKTKKSEASRQIRKPLLYPSELRGHSEVSHWNYKPTVPRPARRELKLAHNQRTLRLPACEGTALSTGFAVDEFQFLKPLGPLKKTTILVAILRGACVSMLQILPSLINERTGGAGLATGTSGAVYSFTAACLTVSDFPGGAVHR